MDASPSTNPYLAGNFAPVRSEDDFELEVVGAFPTELNGVFYRNGPNPQFEPRGRYHWFAGDGMIHAFFVEGGKVAYRNRYVRTPKWQVEHAAGRALFGGFDPRAADPSVMGKDSGVANTNIVWHAGHLLALEEGHKPFELDPASLDSRGYVEPYGGPRHRASQDRPRDRRDGVVRLFGRRRLVHENHVVRRDRREGRGQRGATISRRRSRAWCMTFWSRAAMRCFRSCR